MQDIRRQSLNAAYTCYRVGIQTLLWHVCVDSTVYVSVGEKKRSQSESPTVSTK